MRNDLLAAGAGFGPRERDDYFKFRSRVFISGSDKEKESKRLSKSAGLLTAVNLLILTISLQAPFDVAEKLHSGEIGSTYSEKKRAKIFAEFIDYDGMVLVGSTLAILFFTVAGFPYAGVEIRRGFLHMGGYWLWVTVLAFLLSFREGLSLVYPRGEGMTIVIVMIPVIALIGSTIAILMSEPWRLLAHARARLNRLGFRRWGRSLFCRRPEGSCTPLVNVFFLVCSCVLLLNSVGICSDVPKAFKVAQSQKTVI